MIQSIEAKIPEIENKCNDNSDKLKNQLSTLEETLPVRDDKCDDH